MHHSSGINLKMFKHDEEMCMYIYRQFDQMHTVFWRCEILWIEERLFFTHSSQQFHIWDALTWPRLDCEWVESGAWGLSMYEVSQIDLGFTNLQRPKTVHFILITDNMINWFGWPIHPDQFYILLQLSSTHLFIVKLWLHYI